MAEPSNADFIRFWKAKTWREDDTEQDVREAFLAPLLKHLRYAHDTINDVLRNRSFPLPALFLQVGRKRIQIDYINRVMLRNFWVLEAKGPSDAFSLEHLEQGFFYSMHPSVQARYVVISNGREIRVYDAFSANFGEAIAVSTSDDAEHTFHGIVDALHADKIAANIRASTLNWAEHALSVEVDESVVDEFQAR